MINLRTEDKLILAAARLNPDENEIRVMEELVLWVTDWLYFTQHAIKNGMGPLIHKNLTRLSNLSSIPEKTRSAFNQIYLSSLSRNMVLYEHFGNAVNLFTSQGIEVIALKGIYLADTLYHDIGLRQLSDIDLLVGIDDISRCKKILIESGYRSAENKSRSKILDRMSTHRHIPPLVLNGVSIEIHSGIHNEHVEFRVNINDYLNRAQPVVINAIHCRALSTGDLLQHMCLHVAEQFFQLRLQLRGFCDINELLKSRRDEIDWAAFEQSCNLYNCSPQVFMILVLTNRFFNAPIPEDVLQRFKKADDYKHEQRFVNHLHSLYKEPGSRYSDHNSRILKSIHWMVRNARGYTRLAFPSISFMKQRYRKKSAAMVLPMYLVRLTSGMARFLRAFRHDGSR